MRNTSIILYVYYTSYYQTFNTNGKLGKTINSCSFFKSVRYTFGSRARNFETPTNRPPKDKVIGQVNLLP